MGTFPSNYVRVVDTAPFRERAPPTFDVFRALFAYTPEGVRSATDLSFQGGELLCAAVGSADGTEPYLEGFSRSNPSSRGAFPRSHTIVQARAVAVELPKAEPAQAQARPL